MKDKFDGLLVKMMGIKENIAKVEEENEGLVSQRMKLINRAAVGFEDLTPRPKYKELLGIPVKSHINSTMQIVANLIENSNIKPQKMVQSIILQKKNYKLQETEAIRAQLVDETIKAKEEIKKL